MPTQVLTRSYDNGRTGANITETVLTPVLIGSKGLKRARSLVLQDGGFTDDPRIEAQPLYVPGIRMPDGNIHDVLFVASMGNFIWAFDVNGNGFWRTPQLGTPYKPAHDPKGNSPTATVIDSWGINILWGILATPVIDIDAKPNPQMYFVNWRLQNGKPALFADRVDITTMQPVGQPIAIAASHPGPGPGGNPAVLRADQKVRAAMLLVPLRGSKKTLFFSTTGGENPGAPHGWMVAIDIDSFTQTAAWVSTPSSFGGGMWHASQGPASDVNGDVYAITANGGYRQEHKNIIADFNGTTDFSEAIIRLKYTRSDAGASLTLDDWYIPFRDSDRKTDGNYDYRDQDLGSAAPVLPLDNNLLLASGKDGILYVLDRDHLGKKIADPSVLKAPPIYITYNGIGLPTSVPSTSPAGLPHPPDFDLGQPGGNPSKTHHLHGSPLYWHGSAGPMLFTWGENESLRAWKIDIKTGIVTFVGRSAEVASAAEAVAPTGIGGMPGGMLSLSSNGQIPNSGIVWALAPIDGDANHAVVEGIARAYDATNLDSNPIDAFTPRLKLLWDSKSAGIKFNHSKFCTPTVADGRLFVPTYDGRVDMYVLNS
jgi:hypothetical protein